MVRLNTAPKKSAIPKVSSHAPSAGIANRKTNPPSMSNHEDLRIVLADTIWQRCWVRFVKKIEDHDARVDEEE